MNYLFYQMKFYTKIFFMLLIAAGSISIIISCSEKPQPSSESSEFITGVMLPVMIEITPNTEYVIPGKGFEQGDKLFFEADDHKIEVSVVAVSASSVTIIIPVSIEDGKQYSIIVYRGTDNQTIGTTRVYVRIIANIVIPAEIRVVCGDEFTISGSGFTTGDKIVFVQNIEVVTETKSFSTTGITIVIPQEVDNGKITIKLRRADKDHHLGESTLILSGSFTVPYKPGATIMGLVSSGGHGLSGVSVSDGDLITQTDENGHYWLNSTKRNKQVFVILPSGFEAMVSDAMPQFWAPCKKMAGIIEQIDFALSPKDNDKHTVVVFTDCHLANRNSPIDYIQFRDGMINELKAVYNNANDVIGLNLGDLSHDTYWYANSFALPEAKKELAALNFPVFSAMGNHDNDPYRAGDFNAEEPWRNIMGPVYYSMNIGKIHYIMLDNMIYTNTGGAQGVVGEGNYSTGIDSYQFEWLKKNLALVDANTPIIVGFHASVISYSGVSGGNYVKGNVVSGMSAVMAELRKFNTVHLLTGHTHNSRNITIDYQQGAYERREHNIAAACATWWWTYRYTPNRINIAPDGTPGGYKVFEIDGTNIQWHYKAVGQPRERQFIAFDMNEVKKYWTTNTTALTAFSYSDFAARANDYAGTGDNEVLINVWAFEQDFWKINVREGSTELAVEPVWLFCPLHTISYDIPRRAAGSVLSSSAGSVNVPHMYRVKTSSATSTLEIRVEDRFGNVFTNTMTRPKPLTTVIE